MPGHAARLLTLAARDGCRGETKMKTIATTILGLAAAVALTSAAIAKDWTEIRIGTEGAYPPFNNLGSDGQLVGFDIDLGNALCEKMKVKCSWVAQDWDGIIPALQASKFDVIIAAMDATEERMKVIDFGTPYFSTPLSLIGAKDSALTASPDAYAGKTVGVQASTTQALVAEAKFTGATVKGYPTQDEANADLASGRLDAVLSDKLPMMAYLETEAGKACCKLIGDLERDVKLQGVGSAFAFRKDTPELRDMFNKALDEAKKDGTYRKIQAKYFSFDLLPDLGG
jgi:polar amino acid transport system substrate-binding protein